MIYTPNKYNFSISIQERVDTLIPIAISVVMVDGAHPHRTRDAYLHWGALTLARWGDCFTTETEEETGPVNYSTGLNATYKHLFNVSHITYIQHLEIPGIV